MAYTTKVNQDITAVNLPIFLELPEHTSKPRNIGITHVIDRGMGLRQAEDLLETAANVIDFIKLGWGTSYVTQNLSEKVSLYQSLGIQLSFGGTLFEVARAFTS